MDVLSRLLDNRPDITSRFHGASGTARSFHLGMSSSKTIFMAFLNPAVHLRPVSYPVSRINGEKDRLRAGLQLLKTRSTRHQNGASCAF